MGIIVFGLRLQASRVLSSGCILSFCTGWTGPTSIGVVYETTESQKGNYLEVPCLFQLQQIRDSFRRITRMNYTAQASYPMSASRNVLELAVCISAARQDIRKRDSTELTASELLPSKLKPSGLVRDMGLAFELLHRFIAK